ncbi:MAG: sulfopyruvate decarboxylase subunit beta [Caldisericia bacterium]|nr:sulfopyruvate decarboxylase subunit beta [Caldisericia bacterium]
MRRDEAIKAVCKAVDIKSVLIFANGKISREGYLKCDSKRNFYMLASMGKASSIGLGVALSKPNRTVIVFDGDGNILMNLDNLAMIGYFQPRNLIHIVLDNEIYATTGWQETLSEKIELDKVAKSCGYNNVFNVETEKEIITAVEECYRLDGPHFILIKIDKEEIKGTKIIPYSPPEIKDRFMESLRGDGE